jgi:aminobenzoyl-glutamate utilization protein B
MKTKLCPGWVLALLCTVLFFYGFYLGGVQLVISEVSREYGQNAAGMGGLVAAQHVAAVVLPVVLGALADRIGKKPVLCIFAAVFAVGCFLAGLSKNLGVYVIGTASLGAAIAIKRFLETQTCSGTVILFGCPGEEGGSGKAFMARDGVFDELDAALCWHPDENTGVRVQTSLANCQVLYKFNGKAAHAGAEPHLGRSALDAVELMDVGANYLREHMIDQARVHYAITDAGGFSPNVVQPHAEVLYLIRAPRSAQVKELYERVNDIARGAALMTGTTVEIDFVKACSDTILNDTLQRVLYEKMAQIGVPEITEADEAFARELTETALMEYPKADPVHPIHDELLPYTGQIEYECGSTDVGDVSWVCPTVQAKAATWAFGTPCHSWQAVTQGVMPLAHKMTLYIAKSLAAMGAELMVNAELLERAKQEHRRLVGPEGYVCPIPQGVKPRSMDSLHK